MSDLSDMTVAELEDHLAKLRTDLAEIEEERKFVLSQTGLHVSASSVSKYAAEVSSLEEGIAEAERLVETERSG